MFNCEVFTSILRSGHVTDERLVSGSPVVRRAFSDDQVHLLTEAMSKALKPDPVDVVLKPCDSCTGCLALSPSFWSLWKCSLKHRVSGRRPRPKSGHCHRPLTIGQLARAKDQLRAADRVLYGEGGDDRK